MGNPVGQFGSLAAVTLVIDAAGLTFGRELLKGGPARADSDTATVSATHADNRASERFTWSSWTPTPYWSLWENRRSRLAGEAGQRDATL